MLNDYSVHGFYGSPNTDQSLEEVKDLLLYQLDEIKKGNFSEWILDAIVSDLKLEQIKINEIENGDFGEQDHLSSPNGCHLDCEACANENWVRHLLLSILAISLSCLASHAS